MIVISTALAACGVLLIVAKTLRLKLPKRVYPIVAALAILAMTLWSRYSWAERVESALPQTEQVISRLDYQSVLEPWTYVVPRLGGLLVVDHSLTQTNPDHPAVRLVTTKLYEQNVDTLELQQFVDCGAKRRAPVAPGLPLAQNGLPPEEAWIGGGEPAPLYAAVCGR